MSLLFLILFLLLSNFMQQHTAMMSRKEKAFSCIENERFTSAKT